jgi:hypothetical protein
LGENTNFCAEKKGWFTNKKKYFFFRKYVVFVPKAGPDPHIFLAENTNFCAGKKFRLPTKKSPKPKSHTKLSRIRPPTVLFHKISALLWAYPTPGGRGPLAQKAPTHSEKSTQAPPPPRGGSAEQKIVCPGPGGGGGQCLSNGVVPL